MLEELELNQFLDVADGADPDPALGEGSQASLRNRVGRLLRQVRGKMASAAEEEVRTAIQAAYRRTSGAMDSAERTAEISAQVTEELSAERQEWRAEAAELRESLADKLRGHAAPSTVPKSSAEDFRTELRASFDEQLQARIGLGDELRRHVAAVTSSLGSELR